VNIMNSYPTILINGTIIWLQDDGKVGRNNGPAVEDVCGCKRWFKDGKLHREDGPAVYGCGEEIWFINGKAFDN